MELAFISGPYRANTVYNIKRNIQAAERVALKYWKKGYAVICCHKNTALFDGEAPDELWLEGDLEMLRRCDIIVMMRDWEKSSGARAELKEAERIGLKIIYDDGVE
jgi:hypothetical protein